MGVRMRRGCRIVHMPSPTSPRQVSVRTVPKLLPFIVGAVALAFTVAVVLVYSTPPAENYTRTASLGYMTLILSMPALALAVTAWLTIEKVLRRRQRTYSATTVERAGTDESR